MRVKVPPEVREAPYSATLAQESGWCEVVAAVESVLTERDIFPSDAERAIYLKFEFMDGRPASMGIYGDPPVKVKDFPTRYNSNIYEVLDESLCPTIAENPMHFAMFQYRDNHWYAARVFDSYKESWNEWRASRKNFHSDRSEWFRHLATDKFESVHEVS